MSNLPIPAAVDAAYTNLQTAIAAASPLSQQTIFGINGCIDAAQALITAIDTAAAALSTTIDNFSPAVPPATPVPQLVASVIALQQASVLQAQLSTMRGYAGRILINLESYLG